MTDYEGGVWVVTTGDYSDYRVECAVNGGEKEADALAERVGGESLWLPLVDADVQRVSVLYMSTILWDGAPATEANPVERTSARWPFDTHSPYGSTVWWRWIRAPIYNGRGGRLEVSGTDHERVRKIYSDKRALLMTDDAMRAKRELIGEK